MSEAALRCCCGPPLLAALCALACTSPPLAPTVTSTVEGARAAAPSSSHDAEAPLAQTPHFTFFSRLDFNLHDRLQRWAVAGDRDGAACLATLKPADREGWQRAVTAFEALRDERSKVGLRVRLALAYPAMDFGGKLGEVPSWLRPALTDATAAYRACWWQADDRANRAWLLALTPRLSQLEAQMGARIAAAHHEPWGELPIPVDLVPYVSEEGASTVNPSHILVGTGRPANGGWAGVEIVFHEASHTIVSPRGGASIVAIQEAATRAGVTLPRDLWHAVLFVTAGEIARDLLRELGVSYEPYVYSEGLFTRAWPELRAPLEQHWTPYVRGRGSLEDAASGLAEAFGPGSTP